MAKLRHGEGSVSPYTLADGTVRYRARWWEDGKQRSATKDTEEEAYALLIQNSGDRRIGRYVPVSIITVRDACERHLRRNEGDWSSNTFGEYKRAATNHIYPHIGNVQLRSLTPGKVQSWLDTLAKKKRMRGTGTISTGSIKSARGVLNRMFIELMSLEEISRNPVANTTIPTPKRTERLIWSEEDASKALKAARTIDRQVETYYRVALTTGMRPGEIRALRWSDIDFDNGIVTCRRSMTRKDGREVVGETTKSDRIRSIAVPATTIAALKARRVDQVEARLASEHWSKTDLVFDRGNGAAMVHGTLRRIHISICKQAGIPVCRLHDLRHYAATALLRRGVSAKVVSDLLGHSSITITMDVYSHVDTDMQRAATDLLGEIAE